MEETKLVIPTYRLKDVSDTVKAYRSNMSRFGHDIPIVVFDDSSPATAEEHFPQFSEACPQGTFYVGHDEKAAFIELLVRKVGEEKEPILRKLLRPSYGGNRNFTVLYTLGDFFISVDDDMRPHGLVHKNKEELKGLEVLKGIYVDKKDPLNQIAIAEGDLISDYLSVLGRRTDGLNKRYLHGETLMDSGADLLTNKTLSSSFGPNTICLQPDLEGKLRGTKIITAQTFISGSPDVDAVDYFNDFLKNPVYLTVNDLSMRHVIQGHKPCITKTNWRFSCGFSGYDNREGMPPFIPTKLRFEDYIMRIWLQNPKFAAAHVNTLQTHYRNPSIRVGLAWDLLNEELSNFLKPRLVSNVVCIKNDAVIFSMDGRVTKDEAAEIMQKGRDFFMQTSKRADESCAEYKKHYTDIAQGLREQFKMFDLAQFHSFMQNIISEEFSTLIEANLLWPKILSVVSDIKTEGKLPMRRIDGQ